MPYLRWQTFRYWAVRATVAWGRGWSPDRGKIRKFLCLLWRSRSKLISTYILQAHFNPTLRCIQSTPTSQNKIIRLHMSSNSTTNLKKINQKKWHFTINSLKGPKREIFVAGNFAQIRPIWIGYLETRPKNPKNLSLGP